MKKLPLHFLQALIAQLAFLPTSVLLAQPAALTATGWVSPPHGPRVSDQWVEEWDPVANRWTRIDAPTRAPQRADWRTANVETRAMPHVRFGPFVVASESEAALVGTTDSGSPAHFARMIAFYPHLRTLSFVDAPGTHNDIANLKLGRMIRSSGLATHIPAGGSARSGAVELFLAGSRRTMEPGALFAVHAWRDSRGREPGDFDEDDPANRIYIEYYIEMGMSEADARAFYAMTNSVPHSSALWFGPDQMRRWIADNEIHTAWGAKPNVTIAYRFDHLLDSS